MVNKTQKYIEQPYIDDSNATINDSLSYESKEVSDRDIFRFAKSILMVLAVIFLVGMEMECYHPNSTVFEGGYLIGNQIFSPIVNQREFSFKNFYYRRLLRTLPAYLFVLAVYK